MLNHQKWPKKKKKKRETHRFIFGIGFPYLPRLIDTNTLPLSTSSILAKSSPTVLLVNTAAILPASEKLIKIKNIHEICWNQKNMLIHQSERNSH